MGFLRGLTPSQKTFTWLSLWLCIYTGVFFLSVSWHLLILDGAKLLLGLFFTLFGVGLAFTILFEWLFRRRFEAWETIAVSLFSGLILPPLLLQLEFSFHHTVQFWLPWLNMVLVWAIAGCLVFFRGTPINVPNLRTLPAPLLFCLAFGIIFTLTEILAFPTLPDLDPYKWLFKYTYQFANHLLDYNERPLFGALLYIMTTLSGLSLFAFFKFVLPFLFLTILFPAWLVAERLPQGFPRWLFLLFSFTSPNILLYAGTAMPQMPLIVIAYFFVFFLLYASEREDNFFLYAAGGAMFLAFFYHQAAILPLGMWIFAILIAKRRTIFGNKKVLGVILLLLFFGAPYLHTLYAFAAHWLDSVRGTFLNAHINWLYPGQYSNIDDNVMGWGSMSGILKFYAYYTGPLLGFVLLWFLSALTQRAFRHAVFTHVRESSALVIAGLSFLIFFAIAEILPRYPGIALLPDRAWIFCGIFSYFFLFLLLKHEHKLPLRFISASFFVLLLVGIAGTLYINNQKRYLISPLQLESAHWIQENLPADRLFLTYGYRGLLPVHANTPVTYLPNELYCAQDISAYRAVMQNLTFPVGVVNPLTPAPKLSAPIPNRYIYSFNTLSSFGDRPLYIYYSQTNQKNPYRLRPYGMKSWGIPPCSDGMVLFDRYPELFTRVYARKDNDDEVIIWKITPAAAPLKRLSIETPPA